MSAKARKNRKALNLSVDPELTRIVDAQCALDGVKLSALTERLYVEFLASKGIRIPESGGDGYEVSIKKRGHR